MFAYSKISQQDNESTAQYLVRAKVFLECIHCNPTYQTFQALVWITCHWSEGLREAYICRRVTKEQESWRTMEDVFKSINKVTRTEE